MSNGEEFAFCGIKRVGNVSLTTGGLTKREYFAAIAMQGLLSNQEWMHNASNNTGMGLSEVVTKGAVGMADALLKELEK